ncbi:beta-catenin-interacting protein 1 isoform X2 [Hippopotamus amphibius kiboko]|uniref:beta-catenin-interacting protein 1 isoform X2 n=1 Tax=Hippopotamus amphibius kiboko TaxID=575201 RepID=UPI0025956C72|nr:beta-catenin-interacting protein 1 isoform X2 [Hippopotamus amphibius kiboko]XP_057551856.1 beta-catenin-interacting protein 1 isoform X2 [Hippopotamus amphibius kiboko]XP_057551863.1 beta-catenin-interacting protein 1 isoform X2 [Hippopotamus amphibius kiboko]XP_057551871.1 beta-catenin-interacting protein 1 isoform X2 [Hippopotamus amphibius kiboko]XP_057551879.1 beta-catenin-interacting protein 1 isoform X2 [Hippopotamus amphibius kiboko]
MNREGAPGKSPEEMYIQQKVRVLLMLRKMGSNLTASEEEFLRTYAGVVNSQLSQLPQHSIDQALHQHLQSNLEAHLCPSEGSKRALNLGTTGLVCDPLYLWAGLIYKMGIIIEAIGPVTNST